MVHGLIRSSPVRIAIDHEIVPNLENKKFSVNESTSAELKSLFDAKVQTRSRLATFAGVASVIGFGVSIYNCFSKPKAAIQLFATSALLTYIWIKTRNKGQSLLDAAIKTQDEEEAIYLISEGADLNKHISPHSSTPISPHSSTPISPIQQYALKDYCKVVAYLAMLQTDTDKRSELVTSALSYAITPEMAQLLLDLGAKIESDGQCLLRSLMSNNTKMIRFLSEKGAPWDGGIKDFQQWEQAIEQNHGRINPINILLTPLYSKDSHSRTYAEGFLMPRSQDSNDRSSIIEKFNVMNLAPELYLQKANSEELYQSLNQAGIRIRRQYVGELYPKLQAEIKRTRANTQASLQAEDLRANTQASLQAEDLRANTQASLQAEDLRANTQASLQAEDLRANTQASLQAEDLRANTQASLQAKTGHTRAKTERTRANTQASLQAKDPQAKTGHTRANTQASLQAKDPQAKTGHTRANTEASLQAKDPQAKTGHTRANTEASLQARVNSLKRSRF